MPNWKVNFFFSAGKQGWSETYYTNTADGTGAVARAGALGTARIGLLANNVQFEAIRVSDDAVQGDSDLDAAPQLAGAKLQADALPDPPFVALLIRAQAGLTYRRQLYLRGLPDELINPQGDQGGAIFAKFERNLTRFLAVLSGGNWLIKAIAKAPESPRQVITNITSLNLTQAKITLDGALAGVAIGNKIRIYNVGGVPQADGAAGPGTINGEFRVRDILPGNIYVIDFPIGVLAWNNKGTAKRFQYQFFAIDKAVNLRITHHDTGRPFGASRGRRPARN